MRGHGRQEDVRGRAQVRHAHGLALEVGDAADAFGREQLEAADVHAGDDRDLFAGLDRDEQRRREVQREVDLAAGDQFRLPGAGVGHHVADVGEAFLLQQLLGDVLGRDADAAALCASRMVVVSGGASWANEFEAPTSPAAPADDNVARKLRQLRVAGMTDLLSLELSSGAWVTVLFSAR